MFEQQQALPRAAALLDDDPTVAVATRGETAVGEQAAPVPDRVEVGERSGPARRVGGVDSTKALSGSPRKRYSVGGTRKEGMTDDRTGERQQRGETLPPRTSIPGTPLGARSAQTPCGSRAGLRQDRIVAWLACRVNGVEDSGRPRASSATIRPWGKPEVTSMRAARRP